MAQVYVALVEVVPQPGAELDPEEIAGAFARCYVEDETAESAEARIRSKLIEDKLVPREVSWCVAVDDVDWEDADSEEAREWVEAAQDCDEVLVARLDAYEHNDTAN